MPEVGINRPSVFLDFSQGLAVDTEVGGGSGFQTADTDLDTAVFAVTEVIVFEQQQGLLDLFDQLALTVAGTQFKSELFFLRGAIHGIRKVGSLILHMVNGAVNFLHQLVAPGSQDLAKMCLLLVIHVLLTRFFLVRRHTRNGQGAQRFPVFACWHALSPNSARYPCHP